MAEATVPDSNCMTHPLLCPQGAHVTYRLDGFQQPDAELLDAAVGIRKLHKSLARGRLGLPHANHREHVPKGCMTSLP